MEEDSTDDEVLSDEDDDEMSDDDSPDDPMALVQYKEEARRNALIRKDTHVAEVSPKKGRVEAGGPSS